MADDPTDAEAELDTEEPTVDPDPDLPADSDDDASTPVTEVDEADVYEADDTDVAEADDATEANPDPKREVAAAKPAVRRKVVSKRVTPKGGVRPGTSPNATGPATKATAAASAAKGKRAKHDDDEEISFSSGRYTPPSSSKDLLPSPWWVPALMFGFLIVGALVIMLNYMGAFGDAENYRLIIGLGLILAGIITATQYR